MDHESWGLVYNFFGILFSFSLGQQMHLLVAFITRIQSVYSVLNGSNGILPKNSSQCRMHPEIWEGVMVVFALLGILHQYQERYKSGGSHLILSCNDQ